MSLCNKNNNTSDHKLDVNVNVIEKEPGTEKTRLVKKKKLIEYKILVLGDLKVGKTSLLQSIQIFSVLNSNELQYNNTIKPTTIPKIIDIFSREYDYDKFKLKITYIDSIIKEPILTKQNLKNIDLVYLCFDIFNINSFGDTLIWITKIKEFNKINNKNINIPILLIGCKSDIRDSVSNCIKSETFHQYALSKGAINFVECSSKTNYNIDTIIDISKTVLMKSYVNKCKIL